MLPSRRRRRQPSAGPTDGGFTLVELLVVISILGILAAVAVFAVSSLGDRGKSVATAGDASVIATAEEAYCAQYGHYADIATLHDAGLLASTDSTYNAVGLGALGKCGTGPASSYTIFGTGDDPRISVGHGPTDIDVDPTTDTLYVLDIDDSSVSVIDGTTRAVTATVAVSPELGVGDRLVVDAKNKLVYVTVGSLTGLVAIDATSHTLLGAVTPGAGGALVPGANCVPVVDPSTGGLYAWAADGNGRQYLLAYGADPTHTPPRVVDVSQGLPRGSTYASASSQALELAPTVVDPGRALYQVGAVAGSRYWLAVDLATDAVTLTPFPASGSRSMSDGSMLASTFAGIDPGTHAVSTIVNYASSTSDSGISVAVATLAGGTTAGAAISYPVLDDYLLPDGTPAPDFSYNLSVASAVGMDAATGDTLVWGPPDAGPDVSNGGPQDHVTVYDATFHRRGTTGGSTSAPVLSGYFSQPVVAQKVLAVDPTTHRVYGAEGYNSDPSSGVGYGGIVTFAVENPIPTAVHQGIRFAAVIVDPVTHAVYAVDHERGAVTVVG